MNSVREQQVAAMTTPDGSFPVGSAVVRGVTVRVYENTLNDLREAILQGEQWGDRTAITYQDENYSWTDYLTLVRRFAKALTNDLGVVQGDRVALSMRNYPEWLVAFSATVSIGAICVPLNAWWSADELQFALIDCGPTIFIGDRERVERVQSRREYLLSIRKVLEVRPGATLQGDISWDEALSAQPDGMDLTTVQIDTDQDATIMYTSGTTGRPKGAVATHRSHTANLANMLFNGTLDNELAKGHGYRPFEPAPPYAVSLLAGPLFHIAGLPNSYIAPVTGTQLVLMYKWDPDKAVELIDREQVTVFGSVPTVVRELLDAAVRAGSELPSLSSLGAGGAQAPSQLIGRIAGYFNNKVRSNTAYGLTETTGPMVALGPPAFFDRPLAVGMPFPTSEVRVVDANGDDVVYGSLGEAWFRGPNISRGYWNRESTAFEANGWFRSGDLVRQDSDGCISIVDRIKDIVIRAGENIYCSEVEDAVFTHAAVQEVAVFGVPHDLWGEEVVGVVRLGEDAELTATELRSYLQSKIAGFKIPTTFVFNDQSLPRNAAGKIMKRELRKSFSTAG